MSKFNPDFWEVRLSDVAWGGFPRNNIHTSRRTRIGKKGTGERIVRPSWVSTSETRCVKF